MRGHFNHPGRLVVARCEICGGLVRPDFAFDTSPLEDGSKWAHPDCIAYTTSLEEGVPPRPLRKGQRLIHTCGDPTCIRPSHLKAVR